jgi:hypothetical protein
MKVPMKYQAPFPKCHSKCSATTQGWHAQSWTILVKGLGCLFIIEFNPNSFDQQFFLHVK